MPVNCLLRTPVKKTSEYLVMLKLREELVFFSKPLITTWRKKIT